MSDAHSDGGVTPLRVLQLIGDTDATPEHRAAVELHRELTALGVEVRTLALAPGNVGGLEELVPAVAPSRRSVAARTQVTQERRWADVVVLHGDRVMVPATLRRRSGRPPTVIALGPTSPLGQPGQPYSTSQPGLAGRGVAALRRRVVTAAALLVVQDADLATEVARHWRRAPEDVRVAAGPQDWVDALATLLGRRGNER